VDEEWHEGEDHKGKECARSGHLRMLWLIGDSCFDLMQQTSNKSSGLAHSMEAADEIGLLISGWRRRKRRDKPK
jgi:hypothetical protein